MIFKRSCGAAAAGQCVYCGTLFCMEHGEHGEDHHEICHRPRCRAKYQDLFDHREWVVKHHHANLGGRCADDDCEGTPDIACERCHLRFCLEHVRPRPVREMDLMQRESTITQMLCPHCTARRKLWE